MPRSRGSEVPQRQSPRLRSSSSESEPLHHRPITDRSPKVGERRSPRSAPQSDPVNQKKLGTRIADLESQLGQAQEELKNLKKQLASAEAAKIEAEQELEKKIKKPAALDAAKVQEKNSGDEIQEAKRMDSNLCRDEVPDENQQETDVFEVPVEKVAIEPKVDPDQLDDHMEKETKPVNISTEPQAITEPEKPSLQDLVLKNQEINMLKSKLEEKEKDIEELGQANEDLRTQLNEAAWKLSSAQAKEEEMTLRLNQIGEELEASKRNAAQSKEKLESMEGAKEALEAEMKKMRVQTEQWKKAADAAAAVLSGGVEMNGRISERCGSMDKHYAGVFGPLTGGYTGFVGSPGMVDDLDDGFGSGKRKGSGMKMFGDLWKKKGQK